MGSGSAQSSLLNCFSLHLGHVVPFHNCQHQLPMAFPCIYITTTISATNTCAPTLLKLLSILHRCPSVAWAQQKSICHTSRKWKLQQIRVLWNTLPLFTSPLSYYPHVSQANFSKTVQILAAIKAFLSFPPCFLLHPSGKRHDHVGQVVSVFLGQS